MFRRSWNGKGVKIRYPDLSKYRSDLSDFFWTVKITVMLGRVRREIAGFEKKNRWKIFPHLMNFM